MGTQNDPCPIGWRVPASWELGTLLREQGGERRESEWGYKNGISGRFFGTPPNQIFLPAAGYQTSHGLFRASQWGYYWSNSLPRTATTVRNLWLNSVSAGMSATNPGRRHSVRCVAE